MHSDNMFIWLALILASGSLVAYLAHAAGSSGRIYTLGRVLYVASASVILLASILFLRLILINDFSLLYIAENSSRSLPLYYKISVFWAAQQGSFLFWALCSGILGIWVLRKSREFEPWVMVVWSSIQTLFMSLILIDSPFKLTPLSTAPLDGMGLRELLQNPWMAIHPPLVFIGYAAMCVPAAFAIAALIRGDFKNWSKAALPWAIFGWITLGAGIILGAYWAYEVLGWGGYWGWDPVENASLVPWIVGTALIHSMIAERYRGSFRRINFILAFITILTVFDATLLTRSNILSTDLYGEAIQGSVHTFGNTRVSEPILWFIRSLALLSIALLVWRWSKIQSERSYVLVRSKDYFFYLATAAFAVAGTIVLVGTSLPIIGKFIGSIFPRVLAWESNQAITSLVTGRVKLDQAFYNPALTPIAFAILTLMALAPIVSWRGKKGSTGQGIGIIIAAVVIGLPFLVLRLPKPLMLWFAVGIAFVSVAGLVVNIIAAIKAGKASFRTIGGYSAHFGIALMFLGIVLSANGGASTKVSLSEGQTETIRLSSMGLPQRFEGLKLTYAGNQELSDSKLGAMIRIEQNGKKTIKAVPKIQITNNEELLWTPYIHKSFSRDLYVAPQTIPSAPTEAVIEQGVPQKLDDKNTTLTLTDIDVATSGDQVTVTAQLELKSREKTKRLAPTLIMSRTTKSPSKAVDVPLMPAKISLDRISVEDHAAYVTLTLDDGTARQLKLVRDEKVSAGDYELFFRKWTFPSGQDERQTEVGAEIEITSGGKTSVVTPTYAPRGLSKIESESRPVELPGMNTTIALTGLDPDTKRVKVALKSAVAEVDLSVKPFISFIWIGAIIALLGGSIAMYRRMSESR